MPYYMDFRKSGSGVANVKDQLFFKENYSCAENDSFYQKNPDFDISMDPSTGIVTKTCSDDELPGCNGTDDGVAAEGTW